MGGLLRTMTREHHKWGLFFKHYIYKTLYTLLPAFVFLIERHKMEQPMHFYRVYSHNIFHTIYRPWNYWNDTQEDIIVLHHNSYLLPDDVFVDVGREQGGWGQKSWIHGRHDGGSYSSNANYGYVCGCEKLQGNGQDWACLATIVWGGQAIGGGVPVWSGKIKVWIVMARQINCVFWSGLTNVR